MDYARLLKQNRKKPIATIEELAEKSTFAKLDYGRDDIKKLIPHREPFLLIDNLLGIDLDKEGEVIIGSQFVSADDPVFKGHFPEFPVYPGALQVEMGGQLGLCMTYFIVNNTTSIADDVSMVQVRATKLLGALFLEPLLPNTTVTVIAKRLEYDGYFGTVMSQVISDGKVCTVSIAEVIFLDD